MLIHVTPISNTQFTQSILFDTVQCGDTCCPYTVGLDGACRTEVEGYEESSNIQ